METLINECTSEENTREDWESMIQICDQVNAKPSTAREVVGLLIKRLQHKNVNVILYSLVLSNSLVQNCGLQIKQEICSKPYLSTLTKLLEAGKTHVTVRNRILDLLQTWNEDFKGEPKLDYIQTVYNELKLKYEFPVFTPSPKHNNVSKQKEEEELQLALAMSLSAQQSNPSSTVPKKKNNALFQVQAMYDFVPTESGELALRKGDIVDVHDNTTYPDWWKGSLAGTVGIFPANYVEKINSIQNNSTAETIVEVDEIQVILKQHKLVTELRENIGKATKFGLSSNENNKLLADYQKIVELVPQVIKHANIQRKNQDDLAVLHDRFTNACAVYQNLMGVYYK